MMRSRILLALGIGALGFGSMGQAAEWPQFRGPTGSGVTNEKELPVTWNDDKNVLWTAKAQGRGWSSPVVWGDKVFLTAASSEEDANSRPGAGGGRLGGAQPGGGGQPAGRRPGGAGGFGGGAPPNVVYRWDVYCLDRSTGEVLWKQNVLESKPRIATHGSNTYASETPVTDGERVYAYFGMHGLYCLDFQGKLVWKKDLGAYAMQMGWGTSSSPVLNGNLLYLQIDNEQKSFLVALDRKSGDEVWRVSRTERSNWGTPLVWKNKERTELVTAGSQKVISYDPADGKVLWQLTLGGGRCSASPAADEDMLYVGIGGGPGGGRGGFGGPPGGGPPGGPGGGQPGGRPQGGPGGGMGGFGGGSLFAVKPGASGDITPKQGESASAGVAWSLEKSGPGMASPLVYQGFVYILEQNGGQISCYEAKTGKVMYKKERIPGARAFWASPWAYDGKIFCLDDGGTTHVLQAGPELKVLAKNTIGDQFWATPAISGGALILRGVEGVYCVKQ